MKMMKKILAITTATTMVLGMSVTTFALPEGTSATITINNAGTGARFNETQIVVANPETETGWDIVDAYLDEFQNTKNAFGASVDEQTILKGMIYEATNGAAGSEIENFDTKYAAALDAVWKTIEAPTADTGSTSSLTVTSAGVYVIRGFETGYNYGTMAAYVAFEPYDPSTGLPTDLDDTSVEAKRVPEKTEKSSDDSDKVVEIGRTVTYTVTSTVPYIAPTELATAEYWFKDTLTGGEYFRNQAKNVDVSVSITGVVDPFTYEATPKDVMENGVKKGETISVDMKNLLANNAYANKTITITYKATVKDVTINNDAQTGKAENDPTFGHDSETLYTGEIELIKYAEDENNEDLTNNIKLKDAKFIMYKGQNPNIQYAVVENGKFVRWTSTREEATELTTDSNGNIKVEGLDLGVYYFEETEAPEGYSLDKTPVSVELKLNQDQSTASGIVTARPATKLNTTLSELPGTGGIGTTIFTIGGCLIMIVAAGLFFATRRKAEK